MTDPIAAIILAAGMGTRMKSDLHKVLHPIARRPMLLHLLDAFDAAGAAEKVVVVGARRDQVEAAVAPLGVKIAPQDEQLGTAHAALMAKDALVDFSGVAIVCFGDTPFLKAATIARLVERLSGTDAPRIAVLGFRPDDAKAYGRIIADRNGAIDKVVEYKDASDDERAVKLCNSGVTAVRSTDLWPLLKRVGNDNAAGEYYLPDIITLALADGDRAVVVETDADEVIGINSRAELAYAEARWQAARREAAMAEGASLVAPETVWFAYDTQVGRDVLIEPNVFFGPGVSIADRAIIRANSHIEGATVGEGAEVGPYARLRPGAVLGEKSKVGNFVEVKKTVLGKGAKANHLTYLGDAEIGAGANIGAGTITCNYDGFFKYKTVIGEGAFIGSNSALVAPVTIGAGAIVGAGSTVTQNVEADALRLVRPRQESKPGWGKRFREMMSAKKKG
ncbi:bifunctional UDP-N-acetylglucosamine diphosphorylase/glucosamine-1-phosphate N-acetyltransferase GlmU [Sphingomonas sp.]|jgi:bifunctional UDP-N-acetylglucosamine pyrophosphorylase/glucosamine-1-phosphate N-acetyltransferase|uniref:bifunctional UDP-N-acetylglucosamine diphosphorylase/glucosamine-1-phosphate N-acetyltransferase GlmU n=1 Tax=Sphingomonas sp. TaxID=28214 RepID=UPI002E35D3A2|nr:bifunctional UDP-N-acetylglucosamine diphosphorylase/glucosamine-1-phosphate N-acetyltransferase GlmU [Sphingomonas sp.]HEX4694795.1 bifunctional UDP-N-acetylglucosamine diphosphorylase/glucosamine-1-phosphate N-acetyltransferase GlmU [Sphingomonas sp.]